MQGFAGLDASKRAVDGLDGKAFELAVPEVHLGLVQLNQVNAEGIKSAEFLVQRIGNSKGDLVDRAVVLIDQTKGQRSGSNHRDFGLCGLGGALQEARSIHDQGALPRDGSDHAWLTKLWWRSGLLVFIRSHRTLLHREVFQNVATEVGD